MSGSRNPGVWIVPGGGIEPTEETSMAAIREVLEEAGVKGKLDRCLGVFDVSRQHPLKLNFPSPFLFVGILIQQCILCHRPAKVQT